MPGARFRPNALLIDPVTVRTQSPQVMSCKALSTGEFGLRNVETYPSFLRAEIYRRMAIFYTPSGRWTLKTRGNMEPSGSLAALPRWPTCNCRARNLRRCLDGLLSFREGTPPCPRGMPGSFPSSGRRPLYRDRRTTDRPLSLDSGSVASFFPKFDRWDFSSSRGFLFSS